MIIETVYNEIIAIMETLKGEGQPLAEVYNYPVATSPVYPFAIIDIEPGGTQIDEASNLKMLNFNFVVRCLFSQKNSEAAALQRLQVLDIVLAKFTEAGIADYLNNKVMRMDINFEPFATSQADKPVFGFDILIKCAQPMPIQ